MSPSAYDKYVRAEWERFDADSSNSLAELDAVAGVSVQRVLDVGCGAGQMLTPFLGREGTFGIGLDLNEEVGSAGRQLFAAHYPAARVAFVRAEAERLPWDSDTFDVVVCRVALPYMNNRLAIGEMARVLRPSGILLLRIHHYRFYITEIRKALADANWRLITHDVRVLAAGIVYRLFDRQPRNWLLGTESFQTLPMLERELRRFGLVVRGATRDSTADTPSLIIARASTEGAATTL